MEMSLDDTMVFKGEIKRAPGGLLGVVCSCVLYHCIIVCAHTATFAVHVQMCVSMFVCLYVCMYVYDVCMYV